MFNRLTVIGLNGDKKGYTWYQCECGNVVSVYTADVKRGKTHSCGCLANELNSKRLTGQTGAKNQGWKGGRKISSGYVQVHRPSHPRCDRHGYVPEHRLVAEQALGRFLKPSEVVHHADRDGTNNTKSNLVICPDCAYHHLLHVRDRAFRVCGNAGWRKCATCKQYDDPANMKISLRGNCYYHVKGKI